MYQTLVALAAVLLALPAAVWGGDASWQAQAGRWMADHRAVLKADVFSWTAPGAPWFNHEWLWDVLLYAVTQRIGWSAARLPLFILPAAALGLMVHRAARQAGAGRERAAWAAVAVTSAVAVTPLWAPRPALLGLIAFAAGLLAAQSGRIWLLPLLAAAGANVHASAAFLPPLAFLGRPPLRRQALTAGLSALALLANPWGAGLWLHAAGAALVTQPAVAAYIPEWGAPGPAEILYVIGAAMLIARGLRSGDHAARRAAALAAAFLAMGLFSRRHLPFGSLLCAPLAARLPEAGRGRTLQAAALALLLAAGALSARAVALLGLPEERVLTADMLAPLAAAVQERGIGRVFNDPAAGDFLVGQIPVFADGRADFYEAAGGWWRRAVDLAALRRDPGELDALGVEAAVVRRDQPLARWLAAAPGWRLEAESGAYVLYVREIREKGGEKGR